MKIIFLFSNLKPSFLIVLMLSLFVSCTSNKETKPEVVRELINENGIYVAVNHYQNLFTADNKKDTVNEPVDIIRFLSKNDGVIIPEGLPPNWQRDKAKIKLYYDWCLNYEKKNKGTSEYVHFKLTHLSEDSITFRQMGPESNTVYQAKCKGDTLKVKYRIEFKDRDLLPSLNWKTLDFIFYPL